MSAWSDWQCGAISYEDYSLIMEEEGRRDKYYEDQKYMEEPDEDDWDFSAEDYWRGV